MLVDGRVGCVHRLGQNPDKVRVLYDDDGSKAWVKVAENNVVQQSACDQPIEPIPPAKKSTKCEQTQHNKAGKGEAP